MRKQTENSRRLQADFENPDKRSAVTRAIRTAEQAEQGQKALLVDARGMQPLTFSLKHIAPNGEVFNQTALVFGKIGEKGNLEFAQIRGSEIEGTPKGIVTFDESEWKCAVPSITMPQGEDYSVYALPKTSDAEIIGAVILVVM